MNRPSLICGLGLIYNEFEIGMRVLGVLDKYGDG